MDALKFFDLDIKMMRSQIKMVLLYPAMGFVFIFFLMNDITFIVGFMILGFSIMVTMPFSIENAKKENVFYYTLPARTESMVLGRYLIILSGVLLFTIASILLVICSLSQGGTISELQVFYYSVFAAASVMICLLQYALFYKLGAVKSQQFFTMIQMLPGMALWLAMSFGSRYLQENQGAVLAVLDYGKKHLGETVAIEILLVGLVFYTACKISGRICRKKEL